MAISASRIKAVCTSSEVALVRASRSPELQRLSAAEIKRLAVRARKLSDKWLGLGRGQSRDRRRQTGASTLDANTQLKAQIFREALDSFEAQLATLDSSSQSTRGASVTRQRNTKKQRAVGHRSTRAAIRKGMNVVEDLLNAEIQGARAKAPAAPKPKPASSAVSTTARVKKAGSKSHSATKPSKAAQHPAKVLSTSVAQQRAAATAAKKSRVLRSGKTTRMAGHLVSQGKRSQARRDAKR